MFYSMCYCATSGVTVLARRFRLSLNRYTAHKSANVKECQYQLTISNELFEETKAMVIYDFVQHNLPVFSCTNNAASKSIILPCTIFLYEKWKTTQHSLSKKCWFSIFCLFLLLSNNTLHVIFYMWEWFQKIFVYSLSCFLPISVLSWLCFISWSSPPSSLFNWPCVLS